MVVIAPVIITQLIKYRIRFGPEVKIHIEDEFERALNEAVAQEKFEASLQRTVVRRRKTATATEIPSPEELEYQIAPRRDRVNWTPEIPGVIHDQHHSGW